MTLIHTVCRVTTVEYIYPLSVQTHVPVKKVECLLTLWNHLLLVHHPVEEQEG